MFMNYLTFKILCWDNLHTILSIIFNVHRSRLNVIIYTGTYHLNLNPFSTSKAKKKNPKTKSQQDSHIPSEKYSIGIWTDAQND